MSIELMTEIRDRIFDSPTEKLVAMRLADFADDDGAAIYPKRATVADDCLISERRIRSIFSKFIELGLLVVVKEARGHRQRTYCLKPNVLRGLPLTRAAVARRARKEGRRQTAKGEADGLPKGHRGEADGPPRREADGPPIRTTSRKHQSIEAETSIEDGREVFALASPEPLPQKRGNRLPASWQSTDRDLAFAISEGLTEQEAQREADQFRDFWIAAAGAKASSETGPPRGEPGFATPLIGGALQAADPVDTDRALRAQLKLLLEQPVSIRKRWVDPKAGESYQVLVAVDWPEMTLKQARAALGAIEAAMQPADERSLGALLAELWFSTAKQGVSTTDQQALAGVYLRELATLPGDIATAVLRRSRRECRWFPPLADLYSACTDLARERLWLHRSLEDRIATLMRPTLSVAPLTGCKKAEPNSSSSVSWSPHSGNVDRVARHLGITPKQVIQRVLTATPDELAKFEAIVRRVQGAQG